MGTSERDLKFFFYCRHWPVTFQMQTNSNNAAFVLAKTRKCVWRVLGVFFRPFRQTIRKGRKKIGENRIELFYILILTEMNTMHQHLHKKISRTVMNHLLEIISHRTWHVATKVLAIDLLLKNSKLIVSLFLSCIVDEYGSDLVGQGRVFQSLLLLFVTNHNLW